jgi:outer membrane immunogenic protein
MTKRFGLFAGVAMACLIAEAAGAADLGARPVRTVAPAYVPMAVPTWNGLYIAGGGGYGLYDVESSSFATAFPVVANGTTGGKGWFGTVQVGYDFQMAGWVLGVFGDWDFSSIKGTLLDFNSGSTFELKQSSAWAVGGRIGYLVTPQILGYFDSGYTQAHFRGATGVCVAGGCGGFVTTLPNNTFSGYFLGGGTEVLLNFAPGWSLKSEYRLARYDSEDVALNVTPAVPGAAATLKPIVQTFRTELVYKFNWGR